MEINLDLKEKIQEADIEVMDCVHIIITRLKNCILIVAPTHVEVVVKLIKG